VQFPWKRDALQKEPFAFPAKSFSWGGYGDAAGGILDVCRQLLRAAYLGTFWRQRASASAALCSG